MRIIVSLLVLLFALSPAIAQPKPKPPTKAQKAEAKKLADEATKLYNVQQYDKAAELYQEAYLKDPKPGYLYATAQSQRMFGACDKALLSYEAYLRTNPGDAEAAKAQANIDRCKQDIADKEAAVQAEQVKPVEDLPAPPPPPPPAPKIEPPPPPPPPPPPTKSYILGHVMVTLGAAAVGGGVYFFREGRNAIEDHNNAATYQAFLDGRDEMDAAKQKQTIGVAAMAGGAALLAGGIAYYVWRAKTPLDEQPPPVSATVTAQQATLWLGGSF